ncbi:YebC/PmpR family DNA-binding transcriptional regulator [Candidatus Chlamydia corallus]|uniref:YebC/PmpR family DNA-binding transcriptional regulator n=1 Tax=Candidatus Chlamydia corallus TaxID=2038470 RepID=UPI000C2F9657|nr:YebC/PmpR family DNA-binding transcriptional regulator [Candidatus Chlamydia corallus]
MAGHSKWANTKHRKERADHKKGKIFSRIIKELISAVRLGGADPKSNARLRMVIQKAKDNNIPNENIERNLKKATSAEQKNFEEVTYELYGHGGVGIIVEAMTDNKNRTASDMRIAINKRGGSLVEPGSVLYNFVRKGACIVAKSSIDEDLLFSYVIEAGAEDLDTEDEENFLVICDPSELASVKEKLISRGVICSEDRLIYLPLRLVDCDEKDGEANLALIDWLEQIEDVDDVYHNMS